MIIFNLSALLYFVLLFLAILGLDLTLRNYLLIDHLGLISSIISVLLALLFGLFDSKPKLFFIPAWFYALVFYIVQSWINWGWFSIIINIILFFICYWLYNYNRERITNFKSQFQKSKLGIDIERLRNSKIN